jgi:uncharacterized protein (TIGR02145 family)
MYNNYRFSLIIATIALLLCGCTEVPENCGNYVLRDPVTKECMPSTDPNRPFFTVTVDAGDGTIGAGRYSEREIVAISAGTPEDGQQFKYWTTSSSGVKFDDANNATTKFKMPAGDVTVTAVFEGTSGPVTPPPTDSTAPPVKPTKYAVVVSSESKDATGSGDYAAGDTVTIYAGTVPDGKKFKNWTTSSDGVVFAASDSATTTFVMPAKNVAVIALFEGISGPVAPTKYEVTIVSAGTGATGSGSYAAGDMVTVSAGTAPNGQLFKTWTSSNNGVVFTNVNSATTTFIMPSNAVTVTANFVAAPSSSYESVTIGGNRWMKKNLNIQTDDSWCYGNITDNCDRYGRLYTWEAAKKACPSGWRLPDKADWNKLVAAAGGQATAGKKLKSKSGWNIDGNGTDDYGFSALPGGDRNYGGGFGSAGYYGNWWTATEYNSDNAYYRNMHYDIDNVSEIGDFKSYGFSVRCIQN